jgi:hypothetical protein
MSIDRSEQSAKTSTPVSVYLSPRAMAVLRKYSDNSGFGSMSRTVEELILSYDKIYTTLISTIVGSSIQAFFSDPRMIVMTFLFMINSLNLSDGSPSEQVIKKQIEQWVQSRAGK